MKNGVTAIISLFLLLSIGLGCGLVDRIQESATGPASSNANKTITDKAVDTTVGESRIGVPECDEVLDMLAAEANNPDDNFVTKAVKATFLNRIRDSIRESVEKNKSDKAELAKNCREFKTQLVKFKAEQDANK
jgi:hypothetical protein